MKTLLLIFSILAYQLGFGQSAATCKIEVYLLKKYVKCWDSTYRTCRNFTAPREDWQDTAFIKNEEIVGYTFEKFRTKIPRYKKVTRRIHTIETSVSLTERVQKLNLDMIGKQFVLVVNGEVIYGGYLMNPMSSISFMTIRAVADGNYMELAYNSTVDKDPRENELLFNCLKQTNRFTYSNKKR